MLRHNKWMIAVKSDKEEDSQKDKEEEDKTE